MMYGEEMTERILTMRAVDMDKQEIADRLDISRHTVSNHLSKVRDEVEDADEFSSVIDVEYHPVPFTINATSATNIGSGPDNDEVLERLDSLEETIEETFSPGSGVVPNQVTLEELEATADLSEYTSQE